VLSLTDYIGWRFGFAAKTYVVVLVLFNMSIGAPSARTARRRTPRPLSRPLSPLSTPSPHRLSLFFPLSLPLTLSLSLPCPPPPTRAALLAEFTTIGTIFQAYVGSVAYPMIIVVGVLTLAYTAYGGLLVSIYTDQVQGESSSFVRSQRCGRACAGGVGWGARACVRACVRACDCGHGGTDTAWHPPFVARLRCCRRHQRAVLRRGGGLRGGNLQARREPLPAAAWRAPGRLRAQLVAAASSRACAPPLPPAPLRPQSLPKPMPCSPEDYFCISGTPKCGDFEAAGMACPTVRAAPCSACG
jgi:hypothetical protein